MLVASLKVNWPLVVAIAVCAVAVVAEFWGHLPRIRQRFLHRKER